MTKLSSSKAPTIIAISGWKRSGKDTVASYLIENYGAKRIAFADPLKDLVSELFELDRSSIDDPFQKEAPMLDLEVNPKDMFSLTVADFMTKEFRHDNGDYVDNLGEFRPAYWTRRALCILVGSTMRTVDSDFWVKKAVAQTEPGKLYVISDARYQNEIESLKRTGAHVISVRINRFDNSPSKDPSERDLDNYDFDVVLSNRQTVQDLYYSIESCLIPNLVDGGISEK